MDKMRSLIKSQPAHQVSACTALLNQLKYFAGNQIRNTASVGGNIVTGSPISDSCPLYMACGATFVLQEEGKPQRSVLAEDFFLGYRSALLHCTGLLVCVFLLSWYHQRVWVGCNKPPSATAAMHARLHVGNCLLPRIPGSFCCATAARLVLQVPSSSQTGKRLIIVINCCCNDPVACLSLVACLRGWGNGARRPFRLLWLLCSVTHTSV